MWKIATTIKKVITARMKMIWRMIEKKSNCIKTAVTSTVNGKMKSSKAMSSLNGRSVPIKCRLSRKLKDKNASAKSAKSKKRVSLQTFELLCFSSL